MHRFSVPANAVRMYLLGLADWLCGCRHRKTTMPMTLRPDASVRGNPSAQEGPYVVCLECGRHLAYNVRMMSLAKRTADSMGKPVSAVAKPQSERAIPR